MRIFAATVKFLQMAPGDRDHRVRRGRARRELARKTPAGEFGRIQFSPRRVRSELARKTAKKRSGKFNFHREGREEREGNPQEDERGKGRVNSIFTAKGAKSAKDTRKKMSEEKVG
jgi:hypothetical protein